MAKKLELDAKVSDEEILLTTEEQLALEEEAQEEYKAELKARQSQAFKDATKARLAKKALFKDGEDAVAAGEHLQVIMIDLAQHAPFIQLDGRRYYHGQIYKFTAAQAATIEDISFQTWRHQNEIDGVNMNAYQGRQKTHTRISPHKSAA